LESSFHWDSVVLPKLLVARSVATKVQEAQLSLATCNFLGRKGSGSLFWEKRCP